MCNICMCIMCVHTYMPRIRVNSFNGLTDDFHVAGPVLYAQMTEVDETLPLTKEGVDAVRLER